MASVPPQLTPPTFVQANETNDPRTLVTIDGTTYTPKTWDLETNLHGSTDTATIVLPIKGNPDWTQLIYRGDDAGNANLPVYVEIYAGFPSNTAAVSISQLSRQFYGIVDQYEMNLSSDEVRFSCRSLAGSLVSAKITVGLQGGPAANTTVSFVQSMAKQYNIQTNILLPSGATPGHMIDVLGQDQIAGVRIFGVWDLMLRCAQYDDVDIWVDEQGVLNYVSSDAIVPTPVGLSWGKDFDQNDGLSITHSPQFSKNVLVEVRTYSKKTKTSTTYRVASDVKGGITSTPSTKIVSSQPIFGTNESISTSVSSTGATSTTLSSVTGGSYTGTASAPAAYSGRERYVFFVRNKTPQQCADLARKMWRQISQHEYSVHMSLPVTQRLFGSVNLQSQFNLKTPFQKANGAYYPRKITQSFDPKGSGWRWTIDAINHVNAQGQVN